MKMKSLILIVIALGRGLFATIGISQVMERNSGGGGANMKMEQILAPKGDIYIGAILAANLSHLDEWRAAKVPYAAPSSLHGVERNGSHVRIYTGRPH